MDGTHCPVRSLSGGTGAVRGRSPMRAAEPDSGAGTAIHRWAHVSSLPLAALETAPGCGRGHARNVLREWNLSHLADDAVLLISELLTNAVRQPGNSVCLRLLADREQLIIEAWDQSPDAPQPRRASDGDQSGRGLAVVQGLAHRWGSQRINPGWKVVWAELLTGAGTGR
jgi:anti-sigma regulatory factor (Ser/Thr protein kinase)